MKRRLIHLVAVIAELLRFSAFVLLAQDLGLFRASGVASRLFRYAAAPQLLFAAGFFFLWLDRERYKAYRPLLILGKIVSLTALFPVAFLAGDFLMADPTLMPSSGSVMFPLVVLILVDLGALAILALTGGGGDSTRQHVAPPGRGSADIEKVEG